MFPIIYEFTEKDVLHKAAANGDLEMIKTFIEEKKKDLTQENFSAYINQLHSKYGITALALACEFGHFKIVKLLLENNADVSAGGLRLRRSVLKHSENYRGITSYLLPKIKEIVDKYEVNPEQLHKQSSRDKAKIALIALDLAEYYLTMSFASNASTPTGKNYLSLAEKYFHKTNILIEAIEDNPEILAPIESRIMQYHMMKNGHSIDINLLSKVTNNYLKTRDMFFISLTIVEITLDLLCEDQDLPHFLKSVLSALEHAKKIPSFISVSLDLINSSSSQITPILLYKLISLFIMISTPSTSILTTNDLEKLESIKKIQDQSKKENQAITQKLEDIGKVLLSPNKLLSEEIIRLLQEFLDMEGNRRRIYNPPAIHSPLEALLFSDIKKQSVKEKLEKIGRLNPLLNAALLKHHIPILSYLEKYLYSIYKEISQQKKIASQDFFLLLKSATYLAKILIAHQNIAMLQTITDKVTEEIASLFNSPLKKGVLWENKSHSAIAEKALNFFVLTIREYSPDKKYTFSLFIFLLSAISGEGKNKQYLDNLELLLSSGLLESLPADPRDKIKLFESLGERLLYIPTQEIFRRVELAKNLKPLIKKFNEAWGACIAKKPKSSTSKSSLIKDINETLRCLIQKALDFYIEQQKPTETIYYYGQKLYFYHILSEQQEIQNITHEIQKLLEKANIQLPSKLTKEFPKIFDTAWEAFSAIGAIIPLSELIPTLISSNRNSVNDNSLYEKIQTLIQVLKKIDPNKLDHDKKITLINNFIPLTEYLYQETSWQRNSASLLTLLGKIEKINPIDAQENSNILSRWKIEKELAEFYEQQNQETALEWYERALSHLPSHNEKNKKFLSHKIISLSETLAQAAYEKSALEASIFYYQKTLENFDKNSDGYQITLRKQILVREEIAKKYVNHSTKYYKATSQYNQAAKESKKLKDEFRDNKTFKEEFLIRKNSTLEKLIPRPHSTTPISHIHTNTSQNSEKTPDVIEIASIHPPQSQPSRNRRQRKRNRSRNHTQKQNNSSTKNTIPNSTTEEKPSFWKDGMFMGKPLQSCFLGEDAKIRPILDNTAKPIQKLQARNPYLYKRFKIEIKEGNTTSQGTGKNGSKKLKNSEDQWECKIPGPPRLSGQSRTENGETYIVYNKFFPKGFH